MKNNYTTDKGCFDNRDSDITFYKETNFIKFHVANSGALEPVQSFQCAICGGTEFNVAQGDYLTAIRCPKCLWETGIHEG